MAFRTSEAATQAIQHDDHDDAALSDDQRLARAAMRVSVKIDGLAQRDACLAILQVAGFDLTKPLHRDNPVALHSQADAYLLGAACYVKGRNTIAKADRTDASARRTDAVVRADEDDEIVARDRMITANKTDGARARDRVAAKQAREDAPTVTDADDSAEGRARADMIARHRAPQPSRAELLAARHKRSK